MNCLEYLVCITLVRGYKISKYIKEYLEHFTFSKSILDFESPKVKLHNRYCHKLYSQLDWIERGFLVFGPKCQNDQNQFAIVQSLTRPHSPLTVCLWSQIEYQKKSYQYLTTVFLPIWLFDARIEKIYKILMLFWAKT